MATGEDVLHFRYVGLKISRVSIWRQSIAQATALASMSQQQGDALEMHKAVAHLHENITGATAKRPVSHGRAIECLAGSIQSQNTSTAF